MDMLLLCIGLRPFHFFLPLHSHVNAFMHTLFPLCLLYNFAYSLSNNFIGDNGTVAISLMLMTNETIHTLKFVQHNRL